MQINDIISSGLLELYVLGKTNEQETAQVLAWKAQYTEVSEELLAIEDALEQYDFANSLPPSNKVKENIFASLNNDKQTAPVVPINQAVVKPINNNFKYAAAAMLFLSLSALTFSLYNKNNKANNALLAAEEKIKNQQSELASLQNNLDLSLNNDSRQVVLKSTPTAPANSTAKIFWVKNTGDVYVEASGMPETPKGMQYQLWAIIDGKPVDAGMIIQNTNGKKYNIQKMRSFGKAQAFAITLEKEGGNPTPTMEKLYVMSTI